ncbi:winged helix-turn-helix transcriptional regulator [Buchananella felis]|uniref:helix-turn-helix transcriptional regulator n=1 Tax=Buchananella felis TaxID=3231492 RepID=UPI003526E95C
MDEAGTREAVLDLIVEKGPVTTSTMARILGLTAAAVRRHVTALESLGQIQVRPEVKQGKRGRGRPARAYVATELAHEKLPDEYSALANRAIQYLAQVAGVEAVESFAASRSRELERRYRPIIDAAGDDYEARAHALANALTEDGYAATVRDVGNGGFAVQLCQGHCPVRDVADEFPQLCDAETAAFGRLLDVHIQRLSTLAGGAHACTTHIPLGVPKLRSLRENGSRANKRPNQ